MWNLSALRLEVLKNGHESETGTERAQSLRDLWPSREHSPGLTSCSLSDAHWLFHSFCLFCFNLVYTVCFFSPNLPSLVPFKVLCLADFFFFASFFLFVCFSGRLLTVLFSCTLWQIRTSVFISFQVWCVFLCPAFCKESLEGKWVPLTRRDDVYEI